MKFGKDLMSGLIGLALLALPITAAARDNDSGRNSPHQSVRADAAAHNSVSASVTRNEVREQHDARSFNRAPAVAARRDVREDRHEDRVDARREWRDDRRDWRHDRDGDDRWDRDGYRGRGYYAPYSNGAPYYVMPRGYAGGACAWARHLRAVYLHDRNTGHPSAANDLLPQMRRAERSCGGVPYGYNGVWKYYR